MSDGKWLFIYRLRRILGLTDKRLDAILDKFHDTGEYMEADLTDEDEQYLYQEAANIPETLRELLEMNKDR